jgi:RHS repeat-associated protein
MRGEPYQFFLNTPWGENLENQYAKSYTSFSSRFRFNGKEWDEETGNFYYGARYYDPKISVWLSVDAMAHKFADLSPYVFSMNNPLILLDPDGQDVYKVVGGKLLLMRKTDDKFHTFKNANGISIFQTNQHPNWDLNKQPIQKYVDDYKQIVGMIEEDKFLQVQVVSRSSETGWDSEVFENPEQFIERMKKQEDGQDYAILGDLLVGIATKKAGKVKIPYYDNYNKFDNLNKQYNNGESIPETFGKRAESAFDNYARGANQFWNDLTSTIRATANDIENAVRNGVAPF